jgi:5'-nucleotidase
LQILLVNDDGIHAPGLVALRDELARLGDVQVVAPAFEQSGVGLSITYLHPLMVREELHDGKHFGWAVSGSPADCVKLGVLQFCHGRPDLVVSGINAGANTGINVLYSGTVAGAIEGAFFGVTSIAVSTSVDEPPDYSRSARLAVDLIEQLLARSPSTGSLWNINIPRNRAGWPLGVKTVTLGVKRHGELMERRLDPRGRPYFWSGIDPRENRQMDHGTDVRELSEGFITLTPLKFDLTFSDEVDRLQSATWPFDNENV